MITSVQKCFLLSEDPYKEIFVSSLLHTLSRTEINYLQLHPNNIFRVVIFQPVYDESIIYSDMVKEFTTISSAEINS